MLIGKDTAKSDYINWEIKTAAEMGKRIIGVYLPGAKEEDIIIDFINYMQENYDSKIYEIFYSRKTGGFVHYKGEE